MLNMENCNIELINNLPTDLMRMFLEKTDLLIDEIPSSHSTEPLNKSLRKENVIIQLGFRNNNENVGFGQIFIINSKIKMFKVNIIKNNTIIMNIFSNRVYFFDDLNTSDFKDGDELIEFISKLKHSQPDNYKKKVLIHEDEDIKFFIQDMHYSDESGLLVFPVGYDFNKEKPVFYNFDENLLYV